MKRIKSGFKDKVTRRIVAIFVVVTMLAALVVGWMPSRNVEAVGVGAPSGAPIGDLDDLNRMLPGGNYHLTSDIDVDIATFEPLDVFTGVLDGRGFSIIFTGEHVIEIEYCIENGTDEPYIFWGSLFETVNRGTIRNLDVNLDDVIVTIEDNIDGSPSYDSNNQVTHVFPEVFIGGITGLLTGGVIENSSVSGQIEVTRTIVVFEDNQQPEISETQGDIFNLHLWSSLYVGGIVGRMAEWSRVNACLIDNLNIDVNTGENESSNLSFPILTPWEERHTHYYYRVFAGNIVGQTSIADQPSVGNIRITNNLIEGGGIINIGDITNDNFIGYAGGIIGNKDRSRITGNVYIYGNILRNIGLDANFPRNNNGNVGVIGGLFSGMEQVPPSINSNFINRVTVHGQGVSPVRNFYGISEINPRSNPISESSYRIPLANHINELTSNDVWIESEQLIGASSNGPELRWRTIPIYRNQDRNPIFVNLEDPEYTLAFDLFLPELMHRGEGDRWHRDPHPDLSNLNFRIYADVPGQLAAPMMEPCMENPDYNRFRLTIEEDLPGSPSSLGIDQYWFYFYEAPVTDLGNISEIPNMDDFDPVETAGIIDLTSITQDHDYLHVFVQTRFTAESGAFVSDSVVRRFRVRRTGSLIQVSLDPEEPLGEEVPAELSVYFRQPAGPAPTAFRTTPPALILYDEFVSFDDNDNDNDIEPEPTLFRDLVLEVYPLDNRVHFVNSGGNSVLNSIEFTYEDVENGIITTKAYFNSRPCTLFVINILVELDNDYFIRTDFTDILVMGYHILLEDPDDPDEYILSDLIPINPIIRDRVPGILAQPITFIDVNYDRINLTYPTDHQPSLEWQLIGVVDAGDVGIEADGNSVSINLNHPAAIAPFTFEIWSAPRLGLVDYFIYSPKATLVVGIEQSNFVLISPENNVIPDSRYDGRSLTTTEFRYRNEFRASSINSENYHYRLTGNSLQFRYNGDTISRDSVIRIYVWYGENAASPNINPRGDRSQFLTYLIFPETMSRPPGITPLSYGRGGTLYFIEITGTPNARITYRIGFCYRTGHRCDPYSCDGFPKDPDQSNITQSPTGPGTRSVRLGLDGTHRIYWDNIRDYFTGAYMWITAFSEEPTGMPVPAYRFESPVVTRQYQYMQKVIDAPLRFYHEAGSHLCSSSCEIACAYINSNSGVYFFEVGDEIIIRVPDGVYLGGLNIHTVTGNFPMPNLPNRNLRNISPREWGFTIEQSMVTNNRVILSAEYRRPNFPTRRMPSEVELNIKSRPQLPIPSIPARSRIPIGQELSFALHPDDYVLASHVYYVHRDVAVPAPNNFQAYRDAGQLRSFESVENDISNYRPVIVLYQRFNRENIRATMPVLYYLVNGSPAEEQPRRMPFPLPEIWYFNELISESEFPRNDVPLPNTIMLQGEPGDEARVWARVVPQYANRHIIDVDNPVEATFVYTIYNQLSAPIAIPPDTTGTDNERTTLPFNYVVYLISEEAPPDAQIYFTQDTGIDPRVEWDPRSGEFVTLNDYTEMYDHAIGITGSGGVNDRLSINAIAVAPGWVSSQIVRFHYYVRDLDRVSTPSVHPATNTAAERDHTVVAYGTRIALFAPNAGARIMWGTDGIANQLYEGNDTVIRATGGPGESFTLTTMAFYRDGWRLADDGTFVEEGEILLLDSETIHFLFRIEDQIAAEPPTSWPITSNDDILEVRRGSTVTLHSQNGLPIIYSFTEHPDPRHVQFTGGAGDRRLVHVNNNPSTIVTKIYDSATGIIIDGELGDLVTINAMAFAGLDDQYFRNSEVVTFAYQIEARQAATPVASPSNDEGLPFVIPNNSLITLRTPTSGAQIYYSTVDTPSLGRGRSDTNNIPTNSGTVEISGAPGSLVNIRAIAVGDNMLNSDMALFTFQIENLQVASPPTALPRTTPEEATAVPLGSYIYLQSDMTNATIYYGRNSMPNRRFSGRGIPVDGTPGSTFRIHARVTVPGMQESEVVIFTYQVADLDVVRAPTSWPQTTPVTEEITVVALGSNIFLQSETPGAAIHYSNAGVPNRTFPTGGILVEGTPGSTFRVYARATSAGMQDSDIVIFTYQIENMSKVADPIASPETGDGEPTVIQRGSSIRLRSPTITATIFYSLDGIPFVESRADGTFHSSEGTNQLGANQIVTVPEDWEEEFFTVNAIAVAEGMYDSDIVTFTYRLPASVHPVQANPGSRTVVRNTEVTLSTATEYATIYFEKATNYEELTDPIPGESQVFNLPIIIESDLHIRAVAARDGEVSRITTFSYILADQLMAPEPSIPSGSIVPRGTMLNLTTTEGASITYTKDGTDPTNPENPSRMHGSTIALDAEAGQSISISAFAHMTGRTPSEIVSFTYSVLDANAALAAHPPSGSEVHAGSWVTLVTNITGAEIRYALGDAELDNGSDSISSGGRVQVTGQPGGTFIIRAQAVSGSIESMPMMFYYNISSRAHPPNPSILDGSRITQGTRLAFSVPNGVIYYRVNNTVNGMRTTGNLQTYTGPFILQGDPGTEIRVTAFTRAEGLEDSEERVFVYHMSGQTEAPVARQIINDGRVSRYTNIDDEIDDVDRRQGIMVALFSPTPNAVIYYTSNGTVPPIASPEWIRYEGPFSVHRSLTINMYAVAPDMDPSENERQHIRLNFMGEGEEDEVLEIDDDMDFVLVYTHLETGVQLRMRVTEEGEYSILPEGAFLYVVKIEQDHESFISLRDRVVRANSSTGESEVVDVQVIDLYEIHIYVEENGRMRRLSNGFDEGSIRIGIPLRESYRDAIVRVWHIPNENMLPNPLYTIRRGSRGTIFIQPPSFSHFAVVVPHLDNENQGAVFNLQWLIAMPLLAACIAGSVFVINKKKKRNAYVELAENENDENGTEESKEIDLL